MTTLTLWTSSAAGQTKCSTSKGAEGVCVTEEFHRSEIQRGVQGVCAEALADRDKHRETAASERKRADQCEALRLQPQPPGAIPWRSPWWLRIPLDVALVVVGGSTGAAAGLNAPPEVLVGGVVLELALLSGRLVLEVLDDAARHKAR